MIISGTDFEKFNLQTGFDALWLQEKQFRKPDETLPDFKHRVVQRIGNRINASKQGLTNLFHIDYGGSQRTYAYVSDPTFDIYPSDFGVTVEYNALTQDFPYYDKYNFTTFQHIFDALNIPLEDKNANAVAPSFAFLSTPLIYLQNTNFTKQKSVSLRFGYSLHELPNTVTAFFFTKSDTLKTEVFTTPTAPGEFYFNGKTLITFSPAGLNDNIMVQYKDDRYEIILQDYALFTVTQQFVDHFLLEDVGNVTPLGFDLIPELLANNAYWGK